MAACRLRHINNIYKVEELDRESTCAKIAQVQVEGKRTVKRNIPYFNLDMIISVGYRVKSQRGVQFRQWANQVLKQYLIKGYAVNQRIHSEQIAELRQLVQMVGRTIQNQQIEPNDENQALFDIVVDYTYALDTLDDYDYQRLRLAETTQEDKFHATYENAMEVIKALRDKFGGSSLFGNEKDDSFKSSIGQIYQTFGGEELYPSVEEGRDRDVDNIVEGTGCHAPLSCHQEPLVQRRQQTHCRHALPMVSQQQRHPLSS